MPVPRLGHIWSARDALGLDRLGKLLAAITVVCVALTCYAAVALASAYGPTSYHNTNGWNWNDYSWMETGSTFYAVTDTEHDNNGMVPAGYMGALARSYHSNGTLCQITDWFYNPSQTVLIYNSAAAPGHACGENAAYYSQGESQWWNGSGYAQYTNSRSPDVTATG